MMALLTCFYITSSIEIHSYLCLVVKRINGPNHFHSAGSNPIETSFIDNLIKLFFFKLPQNLKMNLELSYSAFAKPSIIRQFSDSTIP
jgi:hypothetical protein